jgi:MSHA biogenesis protein MshO
MAVRGFTLVELVTVMIVMGILAIGTVRFISDASLGFASTITRTELAGDAGFAIEKISRELRSALPGSVRTNAGCVEFIPIVDASTYTSLPLASAAAGFTAVPFDPAPTATGLRAAVNPDNSSYQLGTASVVSPQVLLSAPDANNEVTVSFAAAHRFPAESASNRFFLVATPVSFCVSGAQLWRYSNYGFNSLQPGPAALPAGLPDRVLIADRVSAVTPFAVNSATLTRSAVVEMDMVFARGDDEVAMQHLVQVRNVP